MLRFFPLSRHTSLHPFAWSNFATLAKSKTNPNTNNSHSRPPKTRKRKSVISQWQGLSPYRITNLRRRSRHTFEPHPGLFNSTFDTILVSSLRAHPMQTVSPLIKHVTSLTPKTYKPSDKALLAILDATISAVSSHHLHFSPADIATETFFRITHAFNIRPTLLLLEAVAKHAATDPIVERRSQRISSILRTVRSLQLLPTPHFIFRCFETCISSLDVPTAVTIMEYALSNGLYHDDLSPRVIDYYNSVMYAAILRGHDAVVVAARDELQRKNIATDHLTHTLLLASYIETSDPRAQQLRARLKPPLPDLVHAATIRAAGRQKNLSAVLDAFHNFEEDLQKSERQFHETLSQPSVTALSPYGTLSEATLATARADPTMSLFRALRTCSAAEEAVEILGRVKERYGYRPSKIVYSTIIETAWKAGKLQLAQKLREDMQAGKSVGYTAPNTQNVGAHFV